MCRLFNSFTMETILATAFGRRVNVLRGESSELSKQIDVIISGITDGQVDGMIMLESKDVHTVPTKFESNPQKFSPQNFAKWVWCTHLHDWFTNCSLPTDPRVSSLPLYIIMVLVCGTSLLWTPLGPRECFGVLISMGVLYTSLCSWKK